MASNSLRIVLIVVLGAAAAVRAQAQVAPSNYSDAQLRAQTGFPRIEEKALGESFRIEAGYYDKAANRYVWKLRPRGSSSPAFQADFMDDRGRATASQALVFAAPQPDGNIEARIEVPASDALQAVDHMVIRQVASP